MFSKTLEILYSLINIFFVTLNISRCFQRILSHKKVSYVMFPENNTLLIIQLKGKIYLI